MAIEISVHGMKVKCDSAREAAQLLRELGVTPNGSLPPSQPKLNTEVGRVRVFLQAIAEAGDQGIGAEALAPKLNTTPRGVGGFMGSVKKAIGLAKLHDTDVLLSSRDSRQNRIWKPGPKIGEVLSTLK